jgi:4-amino-4-deoxy-L-arabinose transferase-like glycosyltransferase
MRGTFTYRSAILILLLGIFTYLYGLDSRFAPKNGDEYPYMHIVRMTAQTGAWLPLQSEMHGVKNTKPPLVFWEGMVATDWGKDWHLAALRWPSIFYTGLTAFLLFLTITRFSGRVQIGLLAALIWLSFFATYRYGRPFLTDPLEVFWSILPLLALLYWGRTAFESRFLYPVAAGICAGLALWSKSFAYVVPIACALSLCYLRWRDWQIFQFVKRDLYKVILIAFLALGIFALWFMLDPFPVAIWNEFVVGENAGKFAARSSDYFVDFVRGGDSIGMLLLTTLANAGLFIFVLLAALVQCWRERRFLSIEESLLLLWITAFWLIFSLPSQRSGRYLLPIMPAFAALIALYWDRLPLWGFRSALVLQGILLGVLTWAGLNLQLSNFLVASGVWTYSIWHWVFMLLALVLVLAGLLKRDFCKSFALAGCFLCYCALNSSLSPLEGSLGRYSATTIEKVAAQDIWIPCDYRAKDEEYRLLLPGAKLHGYAAKNANEVMNLSLSFPMVAVQTPIGVLPELCPDCSILGQRIEMRARQSNEEIKAIIRGQIGAYLFVNEYLIANSVASIPPLTDPDACR